MGKWTSWSVGFVLVGLAASGCGGIEPEDVETSGQPTIYGGRDIQQYYEASSSMAAQLFDAEVMLVSERSNYVRAAGGGYDITGAPTLAQWILSRYGYPLCASEPYANEPTPAFCSGFMVGPDLVATAGHCVTSSRVCNDTTFVFGYRVASSLGGPVTWVPESNVYRCAGIVGRVQTTTEDWAVLRADRTISDHKALPLRRTGTISLATSVAVIGHPAGLPAKYADDATVRANGESLYFEANIDAYAGNSGSAVVSAGPGGEAQVEGILVRGNPDWSLATGDGGYCIASVTCPDTGCEGSGWEEITRSTVFAPYVPEPSVCGNGTCESDETCRDCSTDCGTCPVCLSRGSTCTFGSECCSGSCHPRKHVCR